MSNPRLAGRWESLHQGARACGIVGWVVIVLLAACTPTEPYRTVLPNPPPDCPLSSNDYSTVCQATRHEQTKDYDLLFVEFDDQGLLYPTTPEGVVTPWPPQIDEVIERLHTLAESHNDNITLYVFVHGWKHNAAPDDENVQGFRETLQAAALVEQATQQPHRVIGIYVAWRGLSLRPPGLAEFTFWERKATALYVAQGTVRNLVARIKGFQRGINCKELSACQKGEPVAGQRPKARLIMIGHSFGGLILFNAISEALVESLTHEPDEPNPRFVDMVVLLNPAFEATRYTPLHRIVTDPKRTYSGYQAPILVSITSTADWATRVAFRVGRFINTIFEYAASAEESTAIKNTMGHVDIYLTHTLTKSTQNPAVCQGWKDIHAVEPAERVKQMRVNFHIEDSNDKGFFGEAGRPVLQSHWVRNFCGGAVLTHNNYDPNSPIWNIQTDRNVIRDHGDIQGSVLTNFLRQLYKDSFIYPLD